MYTSKQQCITFMYSIYELASKAAKMILVLRCLFDSVIDLTLLLVVLQTATVTLHYMETTLYAYAHC
jgi:hypothetical protein